MAWRTIGTVSPGVSWKQFDTAEIGGPILIRITHNWTIQPYGYAAIRQEFYDGHWGYRRLYPSKGSQQIFRMTVPPELEAQGVVVWFPAVRLGGYTRRYDGDGWMITVEALRDVVLPDDDATVIETLRRIEGDVESLSVQLNQQGNNSGSSADQIPNGLDNLG